MLKQIKEVVELLPMGGNGASLNEQTYRQTWNPSGFFLSIFIFTLSSGKRPSAAGLIKARLIMP